jgi:membrane protease YdiL (CAAX protease family)
MSAAAPAAAARARRPIEATAWLAPLSIVAGLGGIVALRWLATRAGMDPLLAGSAFGAALLGLAVLAGVASGAGRLALPRMPALSTARKQGLAIAVGGAFGLGLIGIALAGPALTGAGTLPGLGRPAAPFVPWAAITIVVATAEEVLLRGILLDRVRRVGGVTLAVLVTSAVFALLHVPLYGWHVVPLDFAVGLVLGGLRLITNRVAAPAAAHAVADLATWWL